MEPLTYPIFMGDKVQVLVEDVDGLADWELLRRRCWRLGLVHVDMVAEGCSLVLGKAKCP